MKKAIVAIAVILVLAVTAVIVLPLLISTDRIKSQVTESVKAATGRDLSINGKVAISVFPSLSLQVADVALSNPPGFRAPKFVQLRQLDVRLKLLPLLSGRAEVDSFKLIDPVIALEVDGRGRVNWQFGKSGNTESADSGATINEIHLGDVGIENGKLSYSDAKAGTTEEFDAINVKVSLESLDQPLDVKGSASWRKQAVNFSLNVGKPRALVVGAGTTPFTANLAADPVKMTLTGVVQGTDKNIAGDVDLAMPSVRTLVAWTTGKPLDVPGSGFGPLTIKGKLNVAGSHFAFSQAAIGLDGIKSTGELAIDSASGKPAIKGRLDVEMLDLNPYLPPEAQGKDAVAKTAGPQDWSDAPIDAGALKSADIDFALKVGGIKLRKIQVGKSVLAVTLHNGRLVSDLTELELYKGAGNGTIKIDAAGSGIGMEASFSLKGVQAEPLLTDAVSFERLSGAGNAELRITGRGRSQREIISSLSGTGSIAFLDGAVKGIDIAGMVRNVTSAFTGGATARKTDFAELSGTYTITDGILSNKDLAMKAPVFRISGAGTVDLPKRSVNYRIEPKVAATLEGQGGKDAAGLMVPVIVTGPWDNLSYRPDLAALAKGAASQAVKGALDGKLPSLPGLPGGLFPKR